MQNHGVLQGNSVIKLIGAVPDLRASEGGGAADCARAGGRRRCWRPERSAEPNHADPRAQDDARASSGPRRLRHPRDTALLGRFSQAPEEPEAERRRRRREEGGRARERRTRDRRDLRHLHRHSGYFSYHCPKWHYPYGKLTYIVYLLVIVLVACFSCPCTVSEYRN